MNDAAVEDVLTHNHRRLDDLASSQRVRSLGHEHEDEIYRELGKDGYLFFYELDKACEHSTDSNADRHDDGRRTSSSSPGTVREEPAGILQKIEKIEENSAPMPNDAPPPPLPSRLPAITIPPNLPSRTQRQDPAQPAADSPRTPISPVTPSSPTKKSAPRSRTKSFRKSKDISCKTM